MQHCPMGLLQLCLPLWALRDLNKWHEVVVVVNSLDVLLDILQPLEHL